MQLRVGRVVVSLRTRDGHRWNRSSCRVGAPGGLRHIASAKETQVWVHLRDRVPASSYDAVVRHVPNRILAKIRHKVAVLYDVFGCNELINTGVLHKRRQSVSRGAGRCNRAVVPYRYTSVREPEARRHVVVAKFVIRWHPYRK